jgi:hypothetical protein
VSRDNISHMLPVPPASLIVTFACKNGDTLSYLYDGYQAAAILAGADPAAFSGKRVGTPEGVGLGDTMDAVELALNAAELIGELAF